MDIDACAIGQWPNVAIAAGTPVHEAKERYSQPVRPRPCPFCGEPAYIAASSDGYGVQCWNRLCIDMQMDSLPTEAEAIRAWNRRA